MDMKETCNQIIALLPKVMPEGDCTESSPAIRFIQAGCELLLKEGLATESTAYGFSEVEPGVWYCYFWFYDTATGRIIVSSKGVSVQVTIDDWETSSNEYEVADLTDLRFSVKERAYDEAKAEHFS